MVAMVVLVALLNIVSIKWVSTLGELMVIPVMTPFVALFVGIGIKGWFTADRWNVLADANVADMSSNDWATLIGVLIWAIGGTDALGTLAGEVAGGRTAFVKAIVVSAPLVILAYVVPIMFAVVAFPQWRHWHDTAFIVAAHRIGDWLYYWMLVAAAVSCIGQYQSLVASAARAFWASALPDVRPQTLPGVFSRSYRGSHGADSPWAAITLLSVVTLVFAALPFTEVVAVSTLLRLFNLLLEYASFLIFRFKWRHVERPFMAPGGTIGAFLWVLPSVGLCVFYLQAVRNSFVWLVTGATVAAILVLYWCVCLVECCRRKGHHHHHHHHGVEEITPVN